MRLAPAVEISISSRRAFLGSLLGRASADSDFSTALRALTSASTECLLSSLNRFSSICRSRTFEARSLSSRASASFNDRSRWSQSRNDARSLVSRREYSARRLGESVSFDLAASFGLLLDAMNSFPLPVPQPRRPGSLFFSPPILPRAPFFFVLGLRVSFELS